MKLVVEIWPLSIAPSRNDANSSPVSVANVPFCPVLVALDGIRGFGAREVHFAVREGHLEEGELDGLDFGAEFERVGALGDGDVLDEVPNVAVFLGRQPVVGANLAVLPQAELRQAAVQSGGGI